MFMKRLKHNLNQHTTPARTMSFRVYVGNLNYYPVVEEVFNIAKGSCDCELKLYIIQLESIEDLVSLDACCKCNEYYSHLEISGNTITIKEKM